MSVYVSGVLDKYFTPRVPLQRHAGFMGGCAAVGATVAALNGVFSVSALLASPFVAIFLAFTAALALGTSVIEQNGSNQVAWPLWFYEFANYVMWPMNFYVGIVGCYIQSKRHLYPTDKAVNPAALAARADALDEAGLAKLKADIMGGDDNLYKEHDVVQLFDTLPATKVSDLVGHTFYGTALRTGSILDYLRTLVINRLTAMGWGLGKRFWTPYIGDPLIVRTPGNTWIFPYPGLGNVGIHAIDYRGKIQGTMVYDNTPWQDYFRILNTDEKTGAITVLGVWATRDIAGGWFVLTQMPHCPTSAICTKPV